DGRDQRDEPRRRAQGPVGDSLDADRERGAPGHAGDEDQDEHERPRQGLEEARALERQEDLDADERADDEDLGVGKVDEFEDAVDHRVAERDERVHEAEDDAVEEHLREDADEQRVVHAMAGTRAGRGPPDPVGSEAPGDVPSRSIVFYLEGAAMTSRFTSLLKTIERDGTSPGASDPT